MLTLIKSESLKMKPRDYNLFKALEAVLIKNHCFTPSILCPNSVFFLFSNNALGASKTPLLGDQGQALLPTALTKVRTFKKEPA